ncbi:hypothetical protein GNF10_36510 [Nostoc sp. UCD121]|jgi:hypothetical protein|uniref:hypothetical protein n=1 Tax=unclassified Nostoc TaxID=2593658 RepID=UPI00162899F3|nr:MULTISPECIES: hypothetical protein [unclassified Nostoc]MBC1222323.1 hypothetical protein [Nostoc sp. UCD120]MBC1281278.1 hypothetical protein [Nostoc sp. UCD121]MBC1300009.1 hypothetical protein [Nostoc sp. UCD122]
MAKPIGYYCSVTPGDGSFLDELQEELGSTFEELNRLEKLFLLHTLTTNLLQTEVNMVGSCPASQAQMRMTPVMKDINENLLIREHLGLIDAIVNQLKSQK